MPLPPHTHICSTLDELPRLHFVGAFAHTFRPTRTPPTYVDSSAETYCGITCLTPGIPLQPGAFYDTLTLLLCDHDPDQFLHAPDAVGKRGPPFTLP